MVQVSLKFLHFKSKLEFAIYSVRIQRPVTSTLCSRPLCNKARKAKFQRFESRRNFQICQCKSAVCLQFCLWKGSDVSNTILSNIVRTRTSFFEHRTNLNVFICWWSNSNTLFLASNDRTSNFEPNWAFTRFTKLLIEQTRTSFFRTLDEFELVHLWVIELEHPLFCFERLNIELRTMKMILNLFLHF